MVTNRSKTSGKFVVSTAILLAKPAGSSKLRIAVKGGVVVLTVGIVKVNGAFASRKLGSTRYGEAARSGSTGRPKGPKCPKGYIGKGAP